MATHPMRDPYSKAELILNNQELVITIARAIKNKYRLSNSTLEDLIGAGNLGLVEAASRFDCTKNDSFAGYAFRRIRGAMIDHIRKCCKLSPHVHKKLQLAKEHFEQFGTAEAKVEKLSPSKTTPSEDPSPDKIIEERECLQLIKSSIKSLKAKEREVIVAHYLRGIPFKSIKLEGTDSSKGWISRIHKRALLELKERCVSKEP